MISELKASLLDDSIREEEKLQPLTEVEVDKFISEHLDTIEKAVLDMYKAYRNDNELEDLKNAELDWYREFLYDYISPTGEIVQQ
jgi:hypothetical protein